MNNAVEYIEANITKKIIIDEIWLEFTEYKEIYNAQIENLQEVAVGKKYIKLS